ncbi:hypothetical protein G6011_01532 [Alternaria panax]|uniref:Ubiquitin-like-conjugating enzyme ATG10 n=1 Tax=Alternaria panax TaxID=48097 RepID=A0AAD4IL59_9PLEO|nr:hypothetical protein G6011_01532 [Alternaria panax]
MLAAFPHFAETDFERACDGLQRRFQLKGSVQDGWLSVEKMHRNGTVYLNITAHLPRLARMPPVHHRDATEQDEGVEYDEIIEHDEEALNDTVAPQAVVDYDVVLSPVYRVPVLYISIRDPQHRYPTTMTTLYDYLVPLEFRAQTDNVGVIGGITITDHPATNRPVFFIHPCQTADVMQVSVDRNITADEYLMVWIGAVGKAVGLNVPLQLARPNDA